MTKKKYDDEAKKLAEQMSGELDATAESIKASGDQRARSADDMYSQANANFYETVVKPIQVEQKQEEERDRILQAADNKIASLSGATELATALVNMVGVGSFDSANQAPTTFSRDWMQKADADTKERRARIDALRNQQRVANMQLLQQKLQGMQSVEAIRQNTQAQLDNIAVQKANAQADALKAGFNANVNAAEAEAARASQSAEAQKARDFNESQNKAERESREKIADSKAVSALMRAGYTLDANGNWVPNPNAPKSGSGRTTEYPIKQQDGTYKVAHLTDDQYKAISGDPRFATRPWESNKAIEALDPDYEKKASSAPAGGSKLAQFNKTLGDSANPSGNGNALGGVIPSSGPQTPPNYYDMFYGKKK